MKSSKLLGVQYLRGIAALMVVYFHLGAVIPLYAGEASWHLFSTVRLANGVHIFFVISGFIMMATTQHLRPKDFLARRLIRIVPLYWLLTLTLVALKFAPPHFFAHAVVTPIRILKSLLFIPYIKDPADPVVGPLLLPGWTLEVEMFFYLVFTFALLLPLALRLGATSAVFAGLVIVGLFLPGPVDFPGLWLISRPWMLEFAMGMAIGYAYLTGMLVFNRAVCIGLIAIGFAAILNGHQMFLDTAVASTLPPVAIILGVVAWEQEFGIRDVPFLTLLGDASYSLYLSHTFVLGAAEIAWKRWQVQAGGPVAIVLFAVICVTVTVVVALLCYRLLEKPLHSQLQGWYKRRTYKGPKPAQAPVQAPVGQPPA